MSAIHTTEKKAAVTARGESTLTNRLTAVAAFALANAVAHAQDTNVPAAGTNTTTKLPEVLVTDTQDSYKPEVASSPKYTEPLINIPQTITVIPKAVMEAQGATTLADVLRNVPGISMQAGEGGGGLPGDNLSIRGNSARSDIFLDGVREFGAFSRDAFNIESVEVTKGPSSARAGRGSTGGSINQVGKTPGLDTFYNGSIGGGTDDYKRITLDINQSLKSAGLDSAAFRLNAMWHDADVPGRDVVTNERWGVAPSIAFGLGTPTRLTLSYSHLTQNNVPEYGLPWVPANTNSALAAYGNQVPPVSFDNFYGLRNYDFEDVQSDVGTAILEHEFSDSISLRSLLRYNRAYRNSAITAPRFANVNTSTLLNRQLQRREMENEAFVNQTDASFEFHTGPVEHALVAGFELSRELQRNVNSAQTTNQPLADLFNPNPNAQPFGPMPAITGVPNHVQADTVAPYFFDTLKFNEQWQLTGGVRWDHLEADYKSGTNHLKSTDDLLSWNVGLVFKPKPNGSVYLGVGTSFNPSIESGNTGLSLATNTAALNPEETRAFELGTKWDFLEQRLAFDVALFYNQKYNARTPGINPGDPSTVLDGELASYGLELGIQGELTPNWSVTAGYTYQQSEVKKSNTPSERGAEFANFPEHSFSVWTTYRLPKRIEVGGGVRYVDERFNSLSTSPTVRVAPSYYVFDAMVGYAINKNFSLRLNVYNLADERYIDRVGGGHFIPGAGRSAVVTANIAF